MGDLTVGPDPPAIHPDRVQVRMVQRNHHTPPEMLAPLGVDDADLAQSLANRAGLGQSVQQRSIGKANPEAIPSLFRGQTPRHQIALRLLRLAKALAIVLHHLGQQLRAIQPGRHRLQLWLAFLGWRVGQLLGQLEHPGFDLREFQLLF